MKRVIVNDASCLIDLCKGGLLSVLCSLPYCFIVPLPVRESEILNFSSQQWQQLEESGMITHDLTQNEVAQALLLKSNYPGLSVNDCFCFVTARTHNGILLTGDAQLKRIATEKNLIVHGVLWIVDELDNTESCSRSLLIQALERWQTDSAVFLPNHEISTRLEVFRKSRRRSYREQRRKYFNSPMRSVEIITSSS